MIFGVKHPILNEPHYSTADPLSKPSISYTKNVQCKTVLHAMLWWLSSDRAKRNVWGEISKVYWMCKGQEVMKTIYEWADSNE